jgi:hypothetical protein
VRLLADGVEYMHFWSGEKGEPHFTLARVDDSRVEFSHEAALSSVRRYTQFRQVPFARDN